jgi:gluconolactonase
MDMSMLRWACLLALTCALNAEPVTKGKPVNHGSVGAGEGPAWSPKGGMYFSGGNRITRRDMDGKTSVFREQSGGSNGLLFDHEGRLVVCESQARRITRTELDGSVTVLADQFDGHRFNSPNDLTIDSKGRIYFSDPRYGRRETMEMKDAQGKLVEGVYRIDAPGKVARVITHEADRPNGVLVSPRDQYLYVADNNNNNVGAARKLWRFNLKADGSIDAASRKLIFDWENGRGPDGVKMDRKGRLFVAAGLNKPHLPAETADRFKGGVYILSPEGKLLEFVAIPNDEVTNCAFGGDDLKTLFITAGGTLWSVGVDMPGRVPYERK